MQPPTLPSPPRNRRGDRRKTARPPARGKKKRLFNTAQLSVMAALLLIACGALALDISAAGRLNALYRQREQAARDYADLVARHKAGYRDMVEKYAGRYGIQPAFIAAIIRCESSYDPKAVSYAGARGLMQLMPDTGDWVSGKLDIPNYTNDSLFDPETNIAMGAWYINYLCDKFNGDPILVACGYHAGQGNVKSWLSKYSKDGVTLTLDEIPMDDTKSYAGKVMSAYAIYQQNIY